MQFWILYYRFYPVILREYLCRGIVFYDNFANFYGKYLFGISERYVIYMNKLEKARIEINEIDEAMARLFQRRMDAVKLVAEHKKERGLPILDKKREEAVIEKNTQYISDDSIKGYYINFMNYVMMLSRRMQKKLIEGARIAYSGAVGAFAYEACKKMYPDAEYIAYPSFEAAYEAVSSGECDNAVLPIENSFAGDVGVVMDLMVTGDLYINNVDDISVKQNLMACHGARLEDIKEVISHQQALMQCDKYITEHGFEKTEFSNTALAAKFVAEKNDKTFAAIAGEGAAEVYGLDILASGINDSSMNTTRFVSFSRIENKNANRNDDNFILVFTVKNEAGSLAKALNIISKHGYNMRSLHSRPSKEMMWRYNFFVEAEGNIRNQNAENMLSELKSACDKIKLVGSYPAK